MTAPGSSPPVDHLVDAVLQSFGQIAALVEHMAEFAASNAGSGAEPVPVVLRRLLVEVLAPMADAGDDAAIRTAAQMLCAATATVGAELYLVPPAAAAACARRRPARRARGGH